LEQEKNSLIERLVNEKKGMIDKMNELNELEESM